MLTMTKLQDDIYKELVYIHPFRNMNSADYWDLAGLIISDKTQPARRFLSDKLKLRLKNNER